MAEKLDVEGEALADVAEMPEPHETPQAVYAPPAVIEPPPVVSEDDKRRGRVFARAIQIVSEMITGRRMDDDSEGVAAEACADLSSEVLPMLPKWGRVLVILAVLGLPMAATFLHIQGAADDADS